MSGPPAPPVPPVPLVMLAGPGRSTNIVYHALSGLGLEQVVLEDPVPRAALLRRRARRLGVLTVAGQMLFKGLGFVMARRGQGRVRRILEEAGLDDSPIPEERLARVGSVNDQACRDLLRSLAPQVVVVNGTRILGPGTLACLDKAVVLNTHAGITPLFRGVHGGYWALALGRPDLFGATVHRVDAGIDTGGIVAQATCSPGPEDDFWTYPYLQLAVGVPALVKAVARALAGDVPCIAPPQGESRLFSHPTLWGYLARRRRGVR